MMLEREEVLVLAHPVNTPVSWRLHLPRLRLAFFRDNLLEGIWLKTAFVVPARQELGQSALRLRIEVRRHGKAEQLWSGEVEPMLERAAPSISYGKSVEHPAFGR